MARLHTTDIIAATPRRIGRPRGATSAPKLVTPPPLTPGSFVSIAQLSLITTLSKATLWRLWQRGELPPPRPIISTRKGWPAEQIIAWLDARREGFTSVEACGAR